MAQAARLDLPYPEAVVVAEATLGEQTLALASELPERPLVLGGCCCSHVGAVEGLAARHEQMGLVWIDAHGDLNTPESSPSGNAWGMPLRMLLESGAVEPGRVALVGARNLDPPERDFIRESGLHTGKHALDRALSDAGCVYVALDADAIDGSELASFMPEPGGLSLAETERMLGGIRERVAVVGAGLTGLTPEPASVEPLARLCAALGL